MLQARIGNGAARQVERFQRSERGAVLAQPGEGLIVDRRAMQLDALHFLGDLRKIVAEGAAQPIDAFDFHFAAAALDFVDDAVLLHIFFHPVAEPRQAAGAKLRPLVARSKASCNLRKSATSPPTSGCAVFTFTK